MSLNLVRILKEKRTIQQEDITIIGKIVTLDIIQKIVCLELNITEMAFFSKSQIAPIVQARQVYCYYAKLLTDESLTTIGTFIDQSHCTVLHSIRTIKDLLKYNKNLKLSRVIPTIGSMLRDKRTLKTRDLNL